MQATSAFDCAVSTGGWRGSCPSSSQMLGLVALTHAFQVLYPEGSSILLSATLMGTPYRRHDWHFTAKDEMRG